MEPTQYFCKLQEQQEEKRTTQNDEVEEYVQRAISGKVCPPTPSDIDIQFNTDLEPTIKV